VTIFKGASWSQMPRNVRLLLLAALAGGVTCGTAVILALIGLFTADRKWLTPESWCIRAGYLCVVVVVFLVAQVRWRARRQRG
jgi:hypothetical protein